MSRVITTGSPVNGSLNSLRHIGATLEYQGEEDTDGMVATILTSTELSRGEVYRFEYSKSGGYSVIAPDADFRESIYQDPQLHLPAGTYTVTVSGEFSISPEQRPHCRGGRLIFDAILMQI